MTLSYKPSKRNAPPRNARPKARPWRRPTRENGKAFAKKGARWTCDHDFCMCGEKRPDGSIVRPHAGYWISRTAVPVSEVQ